MKKLSFPVACFICAVCFVGCQMLGGTSDEGLTNKGTLSISFDDVVSYVTKSEPSLPDTCDFILKVTDSAGKSIYEGLFGACPESLCVEPGSYNIRVVSSEFLKPAFDSPQFGDEQCVVVPSGGCCNVKLSCAQLNAGVSLDIDSQFLTSYPNEVLFLKSAEGRLMYSYSEKRSAFFLPGDVSLVMSGPQGDQVLMSRQLSPKQMITVKVRVPSSITSPAAGISVSIDTARVWINDECIIGESYKGGDMEDAYSVADARIRSGEEDVWVCGYVVGGDLTSSSASFVSPFESRTNILLGSRSSSNDKSTCLSVQLPSGDVRDALNLVDNPGVLGTKVYLKGDLVESYYGIPGIKNVVEFKF